MARDKTTTPAWQILAQSGSLAGEVARATTTEAEMLRSEFQSFLIAG